MPENENGIVPENEEKNVPGGPDQKKRFGVKQVLMAVIILAVVGSLVQVVVRTGGFGGALSTTGDRGGAKKSETHEAQRPEGRPTKEVNFGSKQPIIVVGQGRAAPGGKVTVQGAGFSAMATVDLRLEGGQKPGAAGKPAATVKSDETGAFAAQVRLPQNSGSAPTTVVAQERGGTAKKPGKTAEAQVISGGGIGTVAINKAVGKPGDVVSLSGRGFTAGEPIAVYWGRVTGEPVTTLRADSSGGIGQASIKVGVAPVGPSTLVLVGQKSKITATAPFQMLGLYPTVKSTPWAVKAAQKLTVSARGFAPDERVLIYINSASGVPAFTSNADGRGRIQDVAFEVPFGLKGKQSLLLVGEQSRAKANSAFRVMPYTPSAEPSTYGGRAGTTLSFYVSGFAPNEEVALYVGGNESGGGRKIATFQVDSRGKAGPAGSYRLTAADESGVTFKLVGLKSGSTAQAGINNSKGGGGGGGGGGGDQGGDQGGGGGDQGGDQGGNQGDQGTQGQ
ncbi:hypothetical protein [Streptomyces bluensis]|uniref:hypothetical protein n=1 Tax=Streptomyces bluensis TaxID=33897 RepID=UPI00332FF474